jgi:hypothetical protein
MDGHSVLEFDYHGYRRVVEPHLLGIHNSIAQLFGYQIRGGSSRGDLPKWRRFDLSDVLDLQVLNEHFTPRAEGDRAPFDQVLFKAQL